MLTTMHQGQAHQPQLSPWQIRYGLVSEKVGSTCVNGFQTHRNRLKRSKDQVNLRRKKDSGDKQLISNEKQNPSSNTEERVKDFHKVLGML